MTAAIEKRIALTLGSDINSAMSVFANFYGKMARHGRSARQRKLRSVAKVLGRSHTSVLRDPGVHDALKAQRLVWGVFRRAFAESGGR